MLTRQQQKKAAVGSASQNDTAMTYTYEDQLNEHAKTLEWLHRRLQTMVYSAQRTNEVLQTKLVEQVRPRKRKWVAVGSSATLLRPMSNKR